MEFKEFDDYTGKKYLEENADIKLNGTTSSNDPEEIELNDLSMNDNQYILKENLDMTLEDLNVELGINQPDLNIPLIDKSINEKMFNNRILGVIEDATPELKDQLNQDYLKEKNKAINDGKYDAKIEQPFSENLPIKTSTLDKQK